MVSGVRNIHQHQNNLVIGKGNGDGCKFWGNVFNAVFNRSSSEIFNSYFGTETSSNHFALLIRALLIYVM